jgi:hypothetical protein
MSKLGIFASVATILVSLGLATLTASAGDDSPAPCVHKAFKTDLVKQACAKGGQEEAKKVMKAWNKEHDLHSCNKCHTKLAPAYELKPDALEQYKKLGGK